MMAQEDYDKRYGSDGDEEDEEDLLAEEGEEEGS